MAFASATTPRAYRGALVAGCYNGVTTYQSPFYCDGKDGPVDGDGTKTENVSYFYQIAADGTKTVVDFATAAAGFSPGACQTDEKIQIGVLTDPTDPAAVDIPVAVVAQPDGTFKYLSLADGSEVTPAAGQEFRNNADGYDIERLDGCIKDSSGATIQSGVELVIVSDEDAAEVSRVVLNSSTGAEVTLAADQTFGPCSGGLASEVTCGCLVDETNSTTRAATQELPRDADSGLVDWAGVAYSDEGTTMTKLATEKFVCGGCPELIDC